MGCSKEQPMSFLSFFTLLFFTVVELFCLKIPGIAAKRGMSF